MGENEAVLGGSTLWARPEHSIGVEVEGKRKRQCVTRHVASPDAKTAL